MSAQPTNADIVRRFTAGLSSGTLDSCLELLDPELVFVEADSLPFGGERNGKQGFLDLLAAVARDFRVRLGEPLITDAGEQVLVQVRGSIESRVTGRGMPLKAIDLYSLTAGLITRVEVFYQDSAAVTALCVDHELGANVAASNGGTSR